LSGILASLGSITYPAISAFVSIHSHADTQGVVQGMVTGMRGLCNGLGPAMFGVIFYLFHVDLNDKQAEINHIDETIKNETINSMEQYTALAPGPPFVFGAFMVVIAILVAVFIPEEPSDQLRRPSGASLDIHYEIERGRKVAGPLSPLMQQDSAQLK
ncbi:Hippocampus abundant transcript-like protein 1, partial [Pseudolycoriella hygida]